MRIIDMRPERTAWKDGKRRKVGNWSFRDTYQTDYGCVREIFHYTTKMGEYNGDSDKMTWEFIPVSIGHGSVSDQGGMNQLMSITYVWNEGMMQDYGYRYYRDNKGGGSRIEDSHGNEVL